MLYSRKRNQEKNPALLKLKEIQSAEMEKATKAKAKADTHLEKLRIEEKMRTNISAAVDKKNQELKDAGDQRVTKSELIESVESDPTLSKEEKKLMKEFIKNRKAADKKESADLKKQEKDAAKAAKLTAPEKKQLKKFIDKNAV